MGMESKLANLSNREIQAVDIWIGRVSREVTSTEIRRELDLNHNTQATRVMHSLEDKGLIKTWQPDSRTDGRSIPAARRSQLTEAGKQAVNDHVRYIKEQTGNPEDRIWKTEKEVQELYNQVERLSTENQHLKEKIKGNTSTINGYQGSLKQLRNDTITEDDIDELTGEIDDVRSELTSVARMAGQAKGRVENFEEEMNTRHQSIEESLQRLTREFSEHVEYFSDVDSWLRDYVAPHFDTNKGRDGDSHKNIGDEGNVDVSDK